MMHLRTCRKPRLHFLGMLLWSCSCFLQLRIDRQWLELLIYSIDHFQKVFMGFAYFHGPFKFGFHSYLQRWMQFTLSPRFLVALLTWHQGLTRLYWAQLSWLWPLMIGYSHFISSHFLLNSQILPKVFQKSFTFKFLLINYQFLYLATQRTIPAYIF